MVALKQDAECLSPRLAVRTAKRLQRRERQLGLGHREPALADQPGSKPGGRGREALRRGRGQDENDTQRVAQQASAWAARARPRAR